MKPFFRASLSSVICLAVLGACAPAKRTLNKASAAPATTQDAQVGTPLQGNILRAEANLPISATDSGQINLVDASGQNMGVNIDSTMKATSADSKTTDANFNCQNPTGAQTLSQCTDGLLNVTVAGAKPAKLTVNVSRRALLPVSSAISLPNTPTPTESDDAFGTASYVLTAVTDPSGASRYFNTVLIVPKTAKPNDVITYDNILNADSKTEQVRFVLQGDLTNKAGTVLSRIGSSDPKASPIDRNGNLVKSFNVSVSTDKTNPTQTITLSIARMADSKTLAGSTDMTKMQMIPAKTATPAATTAPATATPTQPSNGTSTGTNSTANPSAVSVLKPAATTNAPANASAVSVLKPAAATSAPASSDDAANTDAASADATMISTTNDLTEVNVLSKRIAPCPANYTKNANGGCVAPATPATASSAPASK